MRRYKAAIAALLTIGGITATFLTAPAQAAPPGGNDVIANLWSWNWNSVARECTGHLGPAGYGGVQVSPPQDSLTRGGAVWWDVYQPAGYTLTSKFGTENQFASMVRACHAAGVKVYADAVINHMTGQGSTSYGGRTFTKYNYPGLYSPADFHYHAEDCGNSDNLIHGGDYTGSARNVQNCELVGLADLETEEEYVRATIAGYLNKLIALGVDGFRIDAAKHTAPGDLGNIYGRLNGSPYIYQEVIYGGGEAVQPGQYTGIGDVLEFQYGRYLREKFYGAISDLRTFGSSWGGMQPAGQSVTFVANHDTERGTSALSYKDGATYRLANIFQLAWNHGTPQVYDGFTWNDSEAGPPHANGFVTDAVCGGGWECLHRDPAITGMVGFHNAVKGTQVANWSAPNSNVIAFSRGDKGWIVINNGGGSYAGTFATGLPAGTYANLTGGGSVTVGSGGQATVTVPAKGAVAIRAGGTTAPSQVAVTFNVTATTTWGTNVYLAGSIDALKGWDPANAVPLSAAAYPVWSTTVTLPASTSFEYKFIKKDGSGNVTWESGANRTHTTGTSASSVNAIWK
ncbi:alpha amylase C-terminal domain-containing protein [Nonomuraea sp. K274]|uniref:Alpha-amylase n=1 Tax=Nonomuraea cypriaca TaxID=1187855 RepID=A0A931AJT5_9ACTN|nr:carbohydrate-binding module family 20 domain-containing protein [Nonomuraea cypriaca]MBF8191714.1 alpha amylase C-terminal domain-containing protein [Nonomuraea cypriaca]